VSLPPHLQSEDVSSSPRTGRTRTLLSSIQVEMNSIINQKPTKANQFKPMTEAGFFV